MKLEKQPEVELSAFAERHDGRVLVVGRQLDNPQVRSERSYGGPRLKTYRQDKGNQGQKFQPQEARQLRLQGNLDKFKCSAYSKLGYVSKFCRSPNKQKQVTGGNSRTLLKSRGALEKGRSLAKIIMIIINVIIIITEETD